MHIFAEGHDTPLSSFSSTWTSLHTLAPPVGSVDVQTSPPLSTATHSLTDAHDTASSWPYTFVVFHAPTPPAGSVEVTILLPPMATHSSVDGHDIPLRSSATLDLTHAPLPPVGSVEISTSPTPSTATHRPLDGQ